MLKYIKQDVFGRYIYLSIMHNNDMHEDKCMCNLGSHNEGRN